jgi:hypothetical protein
MFGPTVRRALLSPLGTAVGAGTAASADSGAAAASELAPAPAEPSELALPSEEPAGVRVGGAGSSRLPKNGP